MKARVLAFGCLLLAMLLADGRLLAQETASLSDLRKALARAEAVRDSLRDIRGRQQAEVGLLSQRVDSLKQLHLGGVAAGELAEALQQSLRMVVALEQTFSRHEQAQADAARLRARLRSAYDREIRTLIPQLNPADSAQVGELKRLQDLRNALPETPLATAVPIPEVVIRPEDGLEAVQQKTELMSDIALQVHREVAATDTRLKKLEEERRLRNRVQQFSRELFLFDEGLPEGRSVAVNAPRKDENEAPQGGLETTEIAPPDGGKDDVRLPENSGLLGEVTVAPAGEVTTGREVLLDVMDGMAPNPGEDALAFEIRQLQARRAVLADQEARVRARAERLRALLNDMRSAEP